MLQVANVFPVLWSPKLDEVSECGLTSTEAKWSMVSDVPRVVGPGACTMEEKAMDEGLG